MIILIGSEKGGTGKTTAACSLAAYLAGTGADVMLIDADMQASAKRWAERRQEDHPERPVVNCVQASGDVMRPARDMAARYGHIVIDAGGRDSRELRTAMVACDILLIPVRASLPDLETLQHLAELFSMARDLNPRLSAYVLLSMVSNYANNTETRDARGYIAEATPFPVCPASLYDRKAYRTAMVDGLGATELGNSPAKAEVQILGQFVLNYLPKES